MPLTKCFTFYAACAITKGHFVQQESLKINRVILIPEACLAGLIPNDFGHNAVNFHHFHCAGTVLSSIPITSAHQVNLIFLQALLIHILLSLNLIQPEWHKAGFGSMCGPHERLKAGQQGRV